MTITSSKASNQARPTCAGSGLDTVEMEDEEVVQAVQKGIRSRYYQSGRYSVTREQGIHHFHRLIAARLNGGKEAADFHPST